MEDRQPPFGDQLQELSGLLLRMGGMCEEAIGLALEALTNRDAEVARQVIEGDKEIDKLELEIDSLCMEILARHQPMARDLRLITTAIKVTPDLERRALVVVVVRRQEDAAAQRSGHATILCRRGHPATIARPTRRRPAPGRSFPQDLNRDGPHGGPWPGG